jgi:hypothetical protein
MDTFCVHVHAMDMKGRIRKIVNLDAAIVANLIAHRDLREGTKE